MRSARLAWIAPVTVALMLAACGEQTPQPPAAPSAADQIKRGQYLVGLMTCNDCHTPGVFVGKEDKTKYLAGSDIGFFMPGFGYFWGPNLTPDPETGLGKWSAEDVIKALRTGVRPDGRMLAPIMPWQSFASLTDEDANAIVAYLKSLPPITNKAPGPFGPNETPTAGYQAVTFPPGLQPATPVSDTQQ